MTFLIIFFVLQTLSAVLALLKVLSIQNMVYVLRFSYAGFLLFSGFVKLLDPLGFSYKLQEYFEVFGMEWLVPVSLFFSVFIILFEILLGACLIFGFQIKKVMWGNLLLMIFFTFLTFFSAYFNKVTDCGCFGDFMKLDPWHSFFKDIHLVFISILLFVFQAKIKSLSKNEFSIILTAVLIPLMFCVYTLSHLPIVDFRAYKIGTNIIDDRQLPLDAKKDVYEDVWYYEIDGQVQEFSTDEAPWSIDGAVFKDRLTKLISKGDEPPIHDFDIIHPLNGVDITDSILNMDIVFLVVCYDIQKTNLSGHLQLDDVLVQNLDSLNIPFYGLSSSSENEIKNKLSKNDFHYQYFSVDQTTLKTIVRANPGVIMLKKGVIENKWHWRDVPHNIAAVIN